MTTFVEKIEAVAVSLRDAGIGFAFGGALALAYCVGEPRATADIDVNVFAPPDEVATVFASLPDGVETPDAAQDAVRRDGQVRLWWGDTAVDLFFAYHEIHSEADRWARLVGFGDREIPVLSCTHVAVFKVLFDRTRDWADLEAMQAAGTIDPAGVLDRLEPVIGSDDARCAKFRALVERGSEAGPDPTRMFDPPGHRE